jgi:uncharacterized low-complexity protein
MSLNTTRKTMALAIGTAVAALSPMAMADTHSANPFAATELSGGYMQVAEAEGKCGEGKCGGDKAKGEGKCGGDKAKGEGKCGGDKAKGEGKCGEGKCGG